MNVSKTDRIKGGIVGLLVGDALGVPYEFHERQSIPAFAEIEFEPPFGFRRAHAGVPVGTFSDDGAQALILLNTLLECGHFDDNHFAEGLINWYESGFMAVGETVFDVGIQTANAIRKLQSDVSPKISGGSDEYSNGNGSLMRVLPLAIWHAGSGAELIADAFAQSVVTHGHLRSKICCALYCLWARNILYDIENAWENAFQTFVAHFPENTSEHTELTTKIFPTDAEYDIRGSGYVVDSLRASIWLCEKESYEEIVKSAVALGDDTDTTACIAGGIAGLKFGLEAIPRRWRENLRGKNLYEPLVQKLIERAG